MIQTEFSEYIKNIVSHLSTMWEVETGKCTRNDLPSHLRVEHASGACFYFRQPWYDDNLACVCCVWPKHNNHEFTPHSLNLIDSTVGYPHLEFDITSDAATIAKMLDNNLIPTYLELYKKCVASAKNFQSLLIDIQDKIFDLQESAHLQLSSNCKQYDSEMLMTRTINEHCDLELYASAYTGNTRINLNNAPIELAKMISLTIHKYTEQSCFEKHLNPDPEYAVNSN